MMKKLFTRGASNAKLAKGVGHEKLGLFLAPHRQNSKRINLCPWAVSECIGPCLNTAGRGIMATVQVARKRRADEYLADQAAFIGRLCRELELGVKRSQKSGLPLAVRLNGTSDVRWYAEGFNFTKFPTVQFYDYTKDAERFRLFMDGVLPKNYHLTFSFSGYNLGDCLEFLGRGYNVSVVFQGSLPATWHGYPVINGDISDLRFLDPRGMVVGLTAKGKARKIVNAFTSGGLITIDRKGK